MALDVRTKVEIDHHDDPGIVAEINITPLTDIFLVLLIIFMVTSSVMSQLGVGVMLPKASSAVAQAQPEGVIVTVLPDKMLRVNGVSVPLAAGAFEEALKRAFARTSGRTVILEGDQRILLGAAIETMDRARRAGADKFSIAIQAEEKGPR